MVGQRNYSYQSSVYRTKGRSPYGRGRSYKSTARISRNIVSGPSGSLDVAGAKYARLLCDPVNAPVVRPAMNGGQSGQILRFSIESALLSATGTDAAFIWTPGLACVPVGTSAPVANNPYGFLIGGANAGPVTLGTTVSGSESTYVPGFSLVIRLVMVLTMLITPTSLVLVLAMVLLMLPIVYFLELTQGM